MPVKIFYSWQSKTDEKVNRYFLRNCISDAIAELEKDLKGNSPGFILEMDTTGLPGAPNIPIKIHNRIKGTDIYIPDLTFIQKPKEEDTEGISAPNVNIEYGYALGENITEDRIIGIMNTAYGPSDKLPFDIKQRRFPINYHLEPGSTTEQIKEAKKNLVPKIKLAIKTIFQTELERQKQYHFPFENWKTWETTIVRPFDFEFTPYIQELFEEVRKNINTPKTIYRICGLSGIGKTRILFECFTHKAKDVPDELTNKILYVNMNEFDYSNIKSRIKEMVQKSESRILILDNCQQDLHNELVPLLVRENSNLSAITVSTDPDEKAAELYPPGITRLIILQNQLCKPVVTQILANNFKGLHEEEQKLLTDFSSGVSFVATLMAENPDRGQYQPGTLTQENLVRRLLGPLYSDETSKAVIYACSLFSKIGFSDELKHQLEKIALNDDLFSVNTEGIKSEDVNEWRTEQFRRICVQLHERQLLEKKGRTYIFRPSPLAVRMAEDWWRNCTETKFKRILPVLTEADLVESFCEQFKYLKHVENAQAIVKNLCDDFFSEAEVLNTNVGSRLFRSFVYVNPVACTKALSKAFLSLPKEQLEKMTEGRRNLVWALEKLCFRPETFSEAVKVMAAFSIGENENIGNNATSQFLQLFHIQLPGTAVNLEERWNVIQYCFDGNEGYQSLGIRALSSALTVAHFSRMGGAEDQGDPIPLEDYRPSGKEVYEYWRKAIEILEAKSIEDGPFKERSIAILKDNFYGPCSQGAGKLIIPVIEKLITLGFYERMEARTQIQFILNSGRVFEKYAIDELNRLLKELEPTDFSEKFKILVQQPSYDQYNDGDETASHGVNLNKKIEQLSQEFIDQKANWKDLTDNFFTNHIAEGYNFGKHVAEKITNDDTTGLVEILINKLKNAPAENRNISILMGIFSNPRNKELARIIFKQLLDNDPLKNIAFVIVRTAELPVEDISLLIEETKKCTFPSAQFGEFMYGWGLRHLSMEDAKQIIQALRSIDEQGKAVAFSILVTWSHNDKETFEHVKDLLREMIMTDSTAIFSELRNSMDSFYFGEAATKVLETGKDDELAKKIIQIIVEQSNEMEYFYNKRNTFHKLLNILQEKYFPILWEGITNMYLNLDQFGTAAWHLKDLLGAQHDYNNQSEGLLFGGAPTKFDTIFEWCKKNKGRELYWVAELLPVFDGVRSSQSGWHPYALKFINEFGGDPHVLGALSAKLGTYSWVGTVVPKLKSDVALFTEILDHPNKSVRDWAQIHLEDAEKRIKWETNRDEDGILQ